MQQQISASINDRLVRRLRRLAKREDVPFSRMLESAVRRGLPDLERETSSRRGAIAEAMVEAMLTPEVLERAAKIAGEAATDTDLFRAEAERMLRAARESREADDEAA